MYTTVSYSAVVKGLGKDFGTTFVFTCNIFALDQKLNFHFHDTGATAAAFINSVSLWAQHHLSRLPWCSKPPTRAAGPVSGWSLSAPPGLCWRLSSCLRWSSWASLVRTGHGWSNEICLTLYLDIWAPNLTALPLLMRCDVMFVDMLVNDVLLGVATWHPWYLSLNLTALIH